MSRSHKRHPIAPLCGSSQKRDKRHANRALRRTNRVEVTRDSDTLTVMREASNVYSWSQDGTRRWMPWARLQWKRPDLSHASWRKWMAK